MNERERVTLFVCRVPHSLLCACVWSDTRCVSVLPMLERRHYPLSERRPTFQMRHEDRAAQPKVDSLSSRTHISNTLNREIGHSGSNLTS
eukprot:5265134-Prymnesium_polylepis.1